MTNNKIADLETSFFEELSNAESMLVVGGIGNDNGINTVNGNGSLQIYANQVNVGDSSPQQGLIQGGFTLNRQEPKGDEPLSRVLDNIPILSGNASVGS
ncbi:MAG: hypothetical protein RMY64_03105 [Nostoc sp. DedQUE08]|uniref:hypothetical protein n=1 Tax=unclassified Nostoc TaxID=2593658 RepID=UPI002AD53992|nr:MULTISPECIES: hypothetical protein [unclassified Nostoc]MDZ8064616.1 hypothetical protein [Nostoc sp. DedQUE08]MDZ8092609.1 hypothetical protein [Nostoc sp. DedQUE05]MDZ8132644.1 hypothetical protein [Nostoc sp. DedQUE07]